MSLLEPLALALAATLRWPTRTLSDSCHLVVNDSVALASPSLREAHLYLIPNFNASVNTLEPLSLSLSVRSLGLYQIALIPTIIANTI